MLRKWYASQSASPVSMYLLLQLVWVPLYLAAFLAALGLFHARPNAFSSSVTSERTGLQRYLFRPVVLNVFAVCVPIVQATSILVPAGITREYLKRWVSQRGPSCRVILCCHDAACSEVV